MKIIFVFLSLGLVTSVSAGDNNSALESITNQEVTASTVGANAGVVAGGVLANRFILEGAGGARIRRLTSTSQRKLLAYVNELPAIFRYDFASVMKSEMYMLQALEEQNLPASEHVQRVKAIQRKTAEKTAVLMEKYKISHQLIELQSFQNKFFNSTLKEEKFQKGVHFGNKAIQGLAKSVAFLAAINLSMQLFAVSLDLVYDKNNEIKAMAFPSVRLVTSPFRKLEPGASQIPLVDAHFSNDDSRTAESSEYEDGEQEPTVRNISK